MCGSIVYHNLYSNTIYKGLHMHQGLLDRGLIVDHIQEL